jgi:hypothetical protein
MGLGYATLVPETGVPALVIADVSGVKVAGIDVRRRGDADLLHCCRWGIRTVP